MHIPDGLLPPSVSILSYAGTGGFTWYALRQINRDPYFQQNIPKAALLTAAFFVVSLIHIPLPPVSVHLVLNGLLGAILGYYAIPAILIGLFFQAVMFQHGGLSTLGVNFLIQGIPALIAYYLFNLRYYLGNRLLWTNICAFLAGFVGVGLAACLFTMVAVLTITGDLDAQAEKIAILVSLISHGILGLIEGGFTVMLVFFLERVKPELLGSK